MPLPKRAEARLVTFIETHFWEHEHKRTLRLRGAFRMSEHQSPRFNDLLASLPSNELASLRAHATVVEIAANSILYEAGAVLDCIYFPLDSLVSLLVVMPNGSVVEAGFVGPEGAVGTISSGPERTTLTRAIVITSGTALRLPFDVFVQMMDRSKTFRDLIHQNNNRIAERGQQIAACNLSHQLESRLCRWLLQVIDNSDDPNIVITQDNLAQMLGVNRARLNEALKGLHALDAVAPAQRGVLTIIDANLILERACDCYPVVRFPKPDWWTVLVLPENKPCHEVPGLNSGEAATKKTRPRWLVGAHRKEHTMKKAAVIVATIAALGALAVAAPAEARGGFGPGIGFGIAAGALAAGAYGAYGPYGYGPGYGYYGPRYYRPAYYGGPYGYYRGGPRYYRHYRRW
jgi:CRP-like cAMP-binding protein